jgi:hypothetical protein
MNRASLKRDFFNTIAPFRSFTPGITSPQAGGNVRLLLCIAIAAADIRASG